MNCTINWNLDNIISGTNIRTNGTHIGSSKSLILLDIPENIRIVINAKPNQAERYLRITSAQVLTLRKLITTMPHDTIFKTDNAPEIYEMVINFLESNK